MIDFLVKVIGFIDDNVVGIIFLSFFIVLIIINCYYFIHNFIIKIRFKRERIVKNKNFKIARCAEEEPKKRIYIVLDKNGQGEYRHIVNNYTLKKLGYDNEDAGTEEFSSIGRKICGRIELYSIKNDIVFIVGSAEKIKEFKDIWK